MNHSIRRIFENMKRPLILSFIIALISTAISCKNDKPDPPVLPDPVIHVNISHTFKGSELTFNDRYFVTANGDSIQFTRFRYHLNNIVFITADSQEVLPSTQYYLIDVNNAVNTSLPMGQLEGKTFKKVRFTLGVADSITNSDALLNGLFVDPMYWSMASGYINVKVEGSSPDIPINNVLTYHLGGYQGDYKINHTFEIDLGQYELRYEIAHNNLNLRMDLAELFTSPNLIDVFVVNDVQAPNDQAKLLAENFSTMFSLLNVN